MITFERATGSGMPIGNSRQFYVNTDFYLSQRLIEQIGSVEGIDKCYTVGSHSFYVEIGDNFKVQDVQDRLKNLLD